jgi:hypothetical protein
VKGRSLITNSSSNLSQKVIETEKTGEVMDNQGHDHHEDHTVNVTVGIIFIAVLAALFFIGLLK